MTVNGLNHVPYIRPYCYFWHSYDLQLEHEMWNVQLTRQAVETTLTSLSDKQKREVRNVSKREQTVSKHRPIFCHSLHNATTPFASENFWQFISKLIVTWSSALISSVEHIYFKIRAYNFRVRHYTAPCFRGWCTHRPTVNHNLKFTLCRGFVRRCIFLDVISSFTF